MGTVKALQANKFDVSTMDIGDDLTAIGGLKLDKQTLNVVCGYKNDDHSFSIVVTVVKN